MPDDLTVVESKPLPDLSVVSSQPLPEKKYAPGRSFGIDVARGMGLDADRIKAAEDKGGHSEALKELGSQVWEGLSNFVSSSAKDPAHLLDPINAMASGLTNAVGLPDKGSVFDPSGYHKPSVGQTVGALSNILGATEGAKKVSSIPGKIAPSAETIGNTLRTEKGALKPGVTATAATLGGGALGYLGHAIGVPEAGLVGAYVAPKIANALIPESSNAAYLQKGTDLMRRGREQAALDRQAARVVAQEEATKQQTGRGINVVPEPRGNFTGEVPGYMASVPRGTLEDLALAGKPGAAVQLQQLGKPIIYTSRGGGISNVKSRVSLSDMAPGKPEWAYRVRDVGEEGVPANATERRAHATTSLEDAQGIMQDRGNVTGKEQETVRYDLSKLKEGVDYLRHPREGRPDWIQMLRPVPESAIRRVPVQ